MIKLRKLNEVSLIFETDRCMPNELCVVIATGN